MFTMRGRLYAVGGVLKPMQTQFPAFAQPEVGSTQYRVLFMSSTPEQYHNLRNTAGKHMGDIVIDRNFGPYRLRQVIMACDTEHLLSGGALNGRSTNGRSFAHS